MFSVPIIRLAVSSALCAALCAAPLSAAVRGRAPIRAVPSAILPGPDFGAALQAPGLSAPGLPLGLPTSLAPLPAAPITAVSPARLSPAAPAAAAAVPEPAQERQDPAAESGPEPGRERPALRELDAAVAGPKAGLLPRLDAMFVGARKPPSAVPVSAGAPTRPRASFPLRATAAAVPPAPAPGVLARPIRERVELGPVALTVHVSVKLSIQAAKVAAAWHFGGPAVGLAVLAYELSPWKIVGVAAGLTGQTLADLGLRYRLRRQAALVELARSPEVTRLRLLSSARVEFVAGGLLAKRAENTGLVFVETRAPADPAAAAPAPRLRLRYLRDGAAAPRDWTPSLEELFARRPVPVEVAAAWRAHAESDGGGRRERVEASLMDGFGRETPLGAVALGGAARRLAGLGFADRLRARLGLPRAPRAIRVAEIEVTRESAGPSPRRLWRRLTGRLISIKTHP